MESSREINVQIQVNIARKRLARYWFIGCAIAFFFLLLQTVLGKFSGAEKDIWGWFLPSIMPTLLLMVGVYGAEAMRPSHANLIVDIFIFNLARGVSIAYLLTINFTILVEPLSPLNSSQLFEMSQLWLVPLQSLAAVLIGVFFVKTNEGEN